MVRPSVGGSASPAEAPAFRLHHGLNQAVAAPDWPARAAERCESHHIICHTCGTSPVNAGMSLPAVMAHMVPVSAEMTFALRVVVNAG